MTFDDHHQLAMERADEALLAGRRGNAEEERRLLAEAYQHEANAAMQLAASLEMEPTRAVLFRGAAALALDAGMLSEAERMANFGLAGHPPQPLADELREIAHQATFERHVSTHGLELSANELQVAIWDGESVGHGVIVSQELVRRVNRFETLVQRLVARRLQIPFRDDGPPLPPEVRKQFQTYVVAPRGGSFTFTLKVGAAPQLNLFEGLSSVDVVEELREIVELVSQSRVEELERRVPEEAYRRNFIAQAREIAPDGRRVKAVAITTTRSGESAPLKLEPRQELPPVPPSRTQHEGATPDAPFVIRGQLNTASKHLSSRITVYRDDQDKKGTTVKVPKGILNDIVRPYFGELVVVTVRQIGSGLELVEISPAED